MRSDIITVSSRGAYTGAALAQAEKVAVYKELSAKNTLHLRLLTEELMGMMRSITGEPEGKFWIEDQNHVYELHLQVVTRMDSEKRDQLLSAASSGKNESAKGLMGRLRDFFDRGADADVAAMTTPLMLPGMYDISSSTPTLDLEWSMTEYQNALSTRVLQNDSAAREAWDELEKSVVTHVADDIRVSIKGSIVEMTIIKKMA